MLGHLKTVFKRHSFTTLFPALLAGSLLPFAFAPHNIWWLAIVSPAVLLLIWYRSTARQAFFTGFSYGIGMFGVGVCWVFISIHRFGNTDIPTAVLITTLLIVILALFIAFQGYVLRRFSRTRNFMLFALFSFPSSWVLFEWLRGWLFTGFPWLYLGNSQLDTPVAGYAPLLSVFGVSFCVAVTSGALLCFAKRSLRKKIVLSILILSLWGGGKFLSTQTWTQPIGAPRSVALVQGNITPLDKFAQSDPLGTLEKTYQKLTKPYWGHDLILWPESAIPLPLPLVQSYIDKLQIEAEKHNSTLITGVQVINNNNQYHNSLIAVGKGQGIYHKYHLLPYGDYVPFESWLRGLVNFFNIPMSSFTPGPKNQNLITAGTLTLDPLICYEIAFPELVRETLRNANAIITLSEDGWFGDSWGPHQHLQIAQMRALETGRYVLRATTSGITAIINTQGKLVTTIPAFQESVLDGYFQPMIGNTPWLKIGLWPFIIFLALWFVLPGLIRPTTAK